MEELNRETNFLKFWVGLLANTLLETRNINGTIQETLQTRGACSMVQWGGGRSNFHAADLEQPRERETDRIWDQSTQKNPTTAASKAICKNPVTQDFTGFLLLLLLNIHKSLERLCDSCKEDGTSMHLIKECKSQVDGVALIRNISGEECLVLRWRPTQFEPWEPHVFGLAWPSLLQTTFFFGGGGRVRFKDKNKMTAASRYFARLNRWEGFGEGVGWGGERCREVTEVMTRA